MHCVQPKIVAFSLSILFLFSIPTPAKSQIVLTLSCNVIFDHYAGNENAVTSEEVTLTEIKHKLGGMVKVAETDQFEFWVMIHDVQNINGQTIVNNFQVAIKNKINHIFAHALSDSVYTANKKPQYARISLVDYKKSGEMEKGELLFECRNI